MNFEDEIKQGIEDYLNMETFKLHSNLRLCDFKYHVGDYYVLDLYGGLNGRGQFLFYMEDLSELVKMLMIRFDSVWLIKWENDCLDDLFTVTLGMRFKG